MRTPSTFPIALSNSLPKGSFCFLFLFGIIQMVHAQDTLETWKDYNLKGTPRKVVTKAHDKKVVYHFNPDGRLTNKKIHWLDSKESEHTTYQYNPNGSLRQFTETINTIKSVVRYQYDTHGNLVSFRDRDGFNVYVTTDSIDGKITEQFYFKVNPKNGDEQFLRRVTFGYDPNGILKFKTTITEPSIVSAYFDFKGTLLYTLLQKGAYLEYIFYDSIWLDIKANSATKVHLFTKDSSGNILSKSKLAEDGTWNEYTRNSYTFYTNGQLKTVVMTCIERFETKTYTTHFDSLGNRISYKTDTSYAKDYWEYNYEYDHMGNWIKKEMKSKQPTLRTIHYY